MLYGTLTDYCTPETCPVMSAGERYEYHWPIDPKKNSRDVIKVSAPAYIDLLMTWIQAYLDDEAVFPTKIGTPFPNDFFVIVRTIFKRLFRVYAHIYHSHYRTILYDLNAEAHLNTSFRHFIMFVREFSLMDPLEMLPLKELIDWLLLKDNSKERAEKER
jgi:MOB kinase activator 1